MVFDPKNYHLIAQYEVLHRWDCLSNPQPVLTLIELIKGTFRQVPFDGPLSIHRLSQRRYPDLKSTSKNWSKVLAEIKEGKLDTLGFASLAPGGNDFQLAIWFHMHNEIYRRRGPDFGHNNDSVIFQVEIALLEGNVVTSEAFLQLMREVWQQFHGVYGFADVFTSHRTGQISPKQQEATHEIRAKVKTFEVSSPREDIRTKVPDAYWLNFLNDSHVELLGGVGQISSKIKLSLPGAQVQGLPYNGLSIQISPSLIYDTTEVWQADHSALEHVLAPLLPGGHLTAIDKSA